MFSLTLNRETPCLSWCVTDQVSLFVSTSPQRHLGILQRGKRVWHLTTSLQLQTQHPESCEPDLPQSWSTGCFFFNASLKQYLHAGPSLLLLGKLYPPRKLIQVFKTLRNFKKDKISNQPSSCKTYHCTAMTMVTSVRRLRRMSESYSKSKNTYFSRSSRKLDTSLFFL